MGKTSRRKQMGDLLVEAGILKQVNLTEALDRQKRSKKRLGEILQEMGVACEKDIALVLATQFNMRSAPPLLAQPLPGAVQDLVTLQTAMTRFVCPISREGIKLNLAMANPLDLETIDAISFRTELEVVPWVSTPSEILAAIRHHYLGTQEADHRDQCTILVVEGKEIIRAAAVSVLKKEGYRPIEASDGKAALEAVLRHLPQLIITETVMPGMDGRALFGILQENPLTRHIPVIGFSSRASKEDEIALLNLGFVDFLPKPINQKLLAARVGRVLDLVYKGQGFSAKNRTAARDSSSLYEAINTLLGLLQASLDKEAGGRP
jgi:CheY-like chemotaxis protein